MAKQKIIPHLWFDKEAKEAAAFYTSVFPQSGIGHVNTIHHTPAGDSDIIAFDLWGYSFVAISAGPLFPFNPSVSFMVNFDPLRDSEAKRRIDQVWAGLMTGGKALMPLDKYPFSERYGWVQDKFGLSWQLILTNPHGEERPVIMPSLLFTDDICGKAEEASDFYLSVFNHAARGAIARYPGGMAPDQEGTVMFTDFMLEGQWFVAMDSAREHGFAFNEAISLIVNCQGQDEIDYYWKRLSAVPEAEQCGWLKDKYGLSWQITPADMQKFLSGPPEKAAAVTEAFLKMKKLDLEKLNDASK